MKAYGNSGLAWETEGKAAQREVLFDSDGKFCGQVSRDAFTSGIRWSCEDQFRRDLAACRSRALAKQTVEKDYLDSWRRNRDCD